MKFSLGRAIAMSVVVYIIFQISAWLYFQPQLLPLALYSAGLGFILFLYLATRGALQPNTSAVGGLRFLRSTTHPSLIAYAGQAPDYQRVFGSCQLHGREVVLAAALRHPDGTIYAAETPARHSHVICLMAELGQAGPRNTRDQGFLTSCGRYVSREEAFHLAQAAGQIVQKTGSNRELLYSEDVWQGPLVSFEAMHSRAVELVQMAAQQNWEVAIDYVSVNEDDCAAVAPRIEIRENAILQRWRAEQAQN